MQIKNLLSFTVYPRLFAALTIGFVLATIIGTQTHEYAHYITAKSIGFKPALHYQSVSYNAGYAQQLAVLDSIYTADEDKILAKQNSPQKENYLKLTAALNAEMEYNGFLITLTGPLQTIFFGSAGVLILWLDRHKIRTKTALTFKNWVTVFVAFLWSRQLAVLLQKIVYTATGMQSKNGGDEGKVANYLHLNKWSIVSVLAALSAIILTWIVFYIISKPQRFTFIIAGLAGSALGALLWFGWIGPVVLP